MRLFNRDFYNLEITHTNTHIHTKAQTQTSLLGFSWSNFILNVQCFIQHF